MLSFTFYVHHLFGYLLTVIINSIHPCWLQYCGSCCKEKTGVQLHLCQSPVKIPIKYESNNTSSVGRSRSGVIRVIKTFNIQKASSNKDDGAFSLIWSNQKMKDFLECVPQQKSQDQECSIYVLKDALLQNCEMFCNKPCQMRQHLQD